MGAIVMDDCVVENNSIVAAGAVVTQGTHIKAGEIWAGVPAKKNKIGFCRFTGRRNSQNIE